WYFPELLSNMDMPRYKERLPSEANRSMVPISPANSEVHTAPNPGIDRKVLAILEFLATSAILACSRLIFSSSSRHRLASSWIISLTHSTSWLKWARFCPVLNDSGALHSHRRDLQKRAAFEPGQL